LLLSPAASKAKIKEAHKRIMLLNHPDRGVASSFLQLTGVKVYKVQRAAA